MTTKGEGNAAQGQGRHRRRRGPEPGRGHRQRARDGTHLRARGRQGAVRRSRAEVGAGDRRPDRREARRRRGLQGRRHQERRDQGDGRRGQEEMGPHRHPAQQCRRLAVGRRCRAAGHHRGGVRPLRGDQPQELHPGCQARDPDHARAAERRDYQHLVDGGDHHLSVRRLQGDQGGDGVLHRAARLPERAIRHPRQRHPARPDEHADGGRHARPRIQETACRDRGDARRPGPLAQEDGHRLGCRQRRPVPRLRRGELHHRSDTAGRWRCERQKRTVLLRHDVCVLRTER